MNNLLRTFVKTDTRTIQDIASEIGLHPNTITSLIRPDISTLLDQRVIASLKKLAGYYGYDVVVSVEFVKNGEQ